MKSFFRCTIAMMCFITLAGSVVIAQDLQQQISTLGSAAAKGYISPILSGWGNDLNTGIYYSADLHDVLGFDVGVRAGMSKITDADKTYSLDLPASVKLTSVPGLPSGIIPTGGYIVLTKGVNYQSLPVIAPTAVGNKDNVNVQTTGGRANVYSANGTLIGQTPLGAVPTGQTIFTLPGGFDLGSLGVPLPMPQFDLGLPFGLEFMLRYVPTISAGNTGKFNYMGFGLRYSIDQWIPLCPVNIAVHFMTQKMNFKSTSDADIFSANATAYGLEVSKKFFILTIFGGFQIEKSTLSLAKYSYTGNDPTLIGTSIPGFDVSGANTSRFTVGARILLLFINVHAEYSMATTPMLGAGVGITIR